MLRLISYSCIALLALALLSAQTSGFDLTIINQCNYIVELYDGSIAENIAADGRIYHSITPSDRPAQFQHTHNPQATRMFTIWQAKRMLCCLRHVRS